MLGAVLCRATVYRELGERAPIGQAAIVVVVVSGVATVHDYGLGWFPMFTRGAVNLLQWPVWVAIAYLVAGRRVAVAGRGGTVAGRRGADAGRRPEAEPGPAAGDRPTPWRRLLGVLGFARMPGILVALAPVVGGIQFAAHVWMLAAGVIGIREGLGVGTLRAVLAALLGMIPYWIVLVLYLH